MTVLTHSLQYFSSSIDWCEPNFQYSTIIAEFWNSCSSLYISLCGIACIWCCSQNTICSTSTHLKCLYITLIPIGIGSFYFHATLSLMGQLVDEFCIMICIICTLHYVNDNIYVFLSRKYLAIVNAMQIVLMFTLPVYNRLLMFAYGFYFVYMLQYIKRNYSASVGRIIQTAEILFAFSVVFWGIDYMCYYGNSFYGHALWHVLIGNVAFFLFNGFSAIEYHQMLIRQSKDSMV